MIRSRVYVNGIDISERLHRDGRLVLVAVGPNIVRVRTHWIGHLARLLKKLCGR